MSRYTVQTDTKRKDPVGQTRLRVRAKHSKALAVDLVNGGGIKLKILVPAHVRSLYRPVERVETLPDNPDLTSTGQASIRPNPLPLSITYDT